MREVKHGTITPGIENGRKVLRVDAFEFDGIVESLHGDGVTEKGGRLVVDGGSGIHWRDAAFGRGKDDRIERTQDAIGMRHFWQVVASWNIRISQPGMTRDDKENKSLWEHFEVKRNLPRK